MSDETPFAVHEHADESLLISAAEAAANTWGLTPPTLVRIGSTGVFVSDDVILRVGVATVPPGQTLAFADRLNALGIRTARPARPDSVNFDGGLRVTAWERIDFDPDARIDWEQIGTMVAVVHTIDPATIGQPLPFCGDFSWWDFPTMLDEATVDPEVREVLGKTVRRHQWWYEAACNGRLVVCHGDVHPGNVLVDSDGPVLIDWDLLCVGPPEWDHAALCTWTVRWGGEPGLYEAFAAGFARPVDAEMLNALADLRLVAATLMRLRRARLDPGQRAEAASRLRFWRGDPDAPAWRPQ